MSERNFIKQLREYQIVNKIGEGGMGVVYKANDPNLERYVAIKGIHSTFTSNNELVARFRQEAKVQASLIHPNIVSLYNFFVEKEIYYMVMEYVDGETLSDRIKRVGLIPPHKCIPMFIQMLSAVDYAHQKGVIHRDIKPSNILIDKNDNIKVMDFGIAKLIGDRGLTRTGTKMGTVYYMSPEQVMGDKDIDGRSDIFSLGITFFEMITGQLPYSMDTESDFKLMQQIVDNKLPSVKKYYPYVPEKVDKAIEIATKKDKSQRFNSCKEFIDFIIITDPTNNFQQTIRTKDLEFQEAPPSENLMSGEGVQENDTIHKYSQIGGWLLFYCIISVFIRPVYSAIMVIQELEALELLRSLSNEFERFIDVIEVEIMALAFFTIYRFIVGIKIWNKHHNSVNIAKINLIMEFVLMLLVYLMIFATTPPSVKDHITTDILSSIFYQLVGFLIWINYFNKSKRVKATFNI